MRTDRGLNLVSTVYREGSALPAYVYAMPLPYEVIAAHHEALAQVFSKLHGPIGVLGSVQVAAMMLREALKAYPTNPDAPTLLDEINRLCSVASNTDGKWVYLPVEQAIKRSVITIDDWREVEGEVVAFIVASAIQRRHLLPQIMGPYLSAYGAFLTPLSFTDYVASLQTSTPEPALSTEPPAHPEIAPDATTTQTGTDFIPS